MTTPITIGQLKLSDCENIKTPSEITDNSAIKSYRASIKYYRTQPIRLHQNSSRSNIDGCCSSRGEELKSNGSIRSSHSIPEEIIEIQQFDEDVVEEILTCSANSSVESFISEEDYLKKTAEDLIQSNELNIPSLNLNNYESGENDNSMYNYSEVDRVTYTVRDQLTSDRRQYLEMEKRQKSEAFNNWLSGKIEAKRYQRQQKAKRALELLQEQQRYDELKVHLQEIKSKEWLEKKRIDREKRLEIKKLERAEIEKKRQKSLCPQEYVLNFNAWLEKKNLKEKIKQDRLKTEIELKEEYQRTRHEVAQDKYNKWIKMAPHKPKPVPFNQGLVSLRGTISDQYLCPVPWVSGFDEDANNKSK